MITAGLQLSQGTYDSAAKQRAFVQGAVRRIAKPAGRSTRGGHDRPADQPGTHGSVQHGGPANHKAGGAPLGAVLCHQPGLFPRDAHSHCSGERIYSSDDAGKPAVALVNEAFVKQFAAKGDVLGKHVAVTFNSSIGQTAAEIVGVVANVADYQGQTSFQPQIYFPYAQYPDARLTVVARTSLAPGSLIMPLHQVFRSLDKNQAIDNPRTMIQVVTTTNGGNRLLVLLLAIFAILALLLVAIGIYGVIAFTVGQRNREIGVRLALGAHRRHILFMVLKNGIKLAGIGLLIGLPLSLPLPHLLGNIFQHVQIHTAAVLIGVPLFVTLVALFSTYVPALRASKIDLVHALRYE